MKCIHLTFYVRSLLLYKYSAVNKAALIAEMFTTSSFYTEHTFTLWARVKDQESMDGNESQLEMCDDSISW